ncbi:MAG: glycine cleavage system protein H [Sulfobacillus acidophilus]|uniref:Glycine cleavage system H protein n=1 Tax=Sulfobacillus acidophilus TaxID=53633 RepID=A0A2T2WPH2_9FIRM|nr:MAG: glycine cleavage system protein H [Sulfobacillus acidophilus]
MAQYPDHLHYTADHEWVSADGRVGITDYAQDSLGDVVFVELPEVGSIIRAGDTVGVIESVKSVSDLYSPASGRVLQVNSALIEKPELINQDPYGEGWIFELEDAELGDVMSAQEYRQKIEGE